MLDLHKSTEKTIHRMFKELELTENPSDQESKATRDAFLQL